MIGHSTSISERPTWDEYFLEIAGVASKRSNCPRGSYAAVLVDSNNHIIGVGYNGVPSGLPNCNDFSSDASDCGGREDAPGDYSRCLAVHAEINCIANCPSLDKADKIYVSAMPCRDCAKVLANIPISEVHYGAGKARPDSESILKAAGKAVFEH